MTPTDAKRFADIRREVDLGYAVTWKDLVWLVRLVEKLDKSRPPASSISKALLVSGAESINVIRKRAAELEAAKPKRRKR